MAWIINIIGEERRKHNELTSINERDIRTMYPIVLICVNDMNFKHYWSLKG